MKYCLLIIVLILTTSCTNSKSDLRTKYFPQQQLKVTDIPKKTNTWVYLMAGQSNMAGRGLVEPQDTIPNKRVITINKNNELICAKEPIHFYEPSNSGLDLGLSFGQHITSHIADSITVLIIPTAIGGSSIDQWINDETHRNVKLLSNFRNKVEIGKSYGEIKGILWHQGESDTKSSLQLSNYFKNLSILFKEFRRITQSNNLPILVGTLGSFSKDKEAYKKINLQIEKYGKIDKNTKVINTYDLMDIGDNIHFDSNSIRILGERYAEQILNMK